jgi:Fe2+ or Zn2+ uptake regulation protein
MSSLEDLEKKIRERKIRVEDRLEILRLLSESDAEARLRAKQEELLRAAREASNRLKGTAG